ncbi:MAG: glycosyltransferase family 2 protein [Nanoarchaeota archaeon]
MIDIIITSYNEPQSTLGVVKAFLNQAKGRKDIRITVVDPFPEVKKFLKKHVKDKRFVFFLDPGEGKAYALNLLFQEYASQDTNDLFILTDGDVIISKSIIKSIETAFEEQNLGCITGKPVPLDDPNTKYGWWAHLAFRGIDRARQELFRKRKFFECSGYLFAIRKGVITDFPLETSEDSIIPYLFWKKGFSTGYVPEAEVSVKNPSNWKDWLAQKIRNIKAHENLNKIAPDLPRTKSFFNEVKWGIFFAIRQPRTLKQLWWTIELYFARLYLYYKAFKELRKKQAYQDGWRGQATTESTKIDVILKTTEKSSTPSESLPQVPPENSQ